MNYNLWFWGFVFCLFVFYFSYLGLHRNLREGKKRREERRNRRREGRGVEGKTEKEKGEDGRGRK